MLLLRTWISSVAHAAALPLLVAAPVAATHCAAFSESAVAALLLVSPLDVVQLRALKFKIFAFFDCLMTACLLVFRADRAGTQRWPQSRAVSNIYFDWVRAHST